MLHAIPFLQLYQTWQKQQAERAAAAKAGGGGAAAAGAPTAAAARIPGVTDAFYAKSATALEVRRQ